MRRPLAPALAALALFLAVPAGASAATAQFWIRGGGFGHGIGMSQYGAYGYALHGRDYRWILHHYYSHTALGSVASTRPVRVLLEQRSGVSFSGARSAGGHRLDPGKRYSASVARGQVSIEGIGRVGSRLTVGGSSLRVGGTSMNGLSNGRYRGALALYARGSGVAVVNVLGVDDYVRGVVAGEMPSSWSMEALKAQAVAARTYAITAAGGGELYPDTRSQVYNGIAGESSRSNAAVSATGGRVVTYRGRPVITYFSSTSGGRTANVEDSFIGATPEPWLRSVVDQYDSVSPYHRWGPDAMSLRTAAAKLHGYVRGSFRGIQVVRRGASPRVVSANVLGSRGRTRISGPTLKYRLGLNDTLAYFTVSSRRPARNFGEPRGTPGAGTPPSTTAGPKPPPAQLPSAVSGGAAFGTMPADTGSGGAGAPSGR